MLDSVPYGELLEGSFGGDAAKALARSEPEEFRGEVPDSWVDLASTLDRAALRSMWAPSGGVFTRFVGYLERSLEWCGIARIGASPILVLALPDWEESGADLAPGFCIMGPPTDPERIAAFEDVVGPLPASLTALWRVTSCMNLKDGSTLCSLDPRTLTMAESPAEIGLWTERGANPRTFECLQVAVVNADMVTCVTRVPGAKKWDDYLLRCFRRTREVASAVRLTIPDKLADWTFHDLDL